MARDVSQREWETTKPWTADRVSVCNIDRILSVGSDVWGRTGKPQPIRFSATLGLSRPFSTAASTDSVDSSTIHYGLLSKQIILMCDKFEKEPFESIYDLSTVFTQGLTHLPNFVETVSWLELTTTLTKASRFGQAVSLRHSTSYPDQTAYRSLELSKMTVPCIIGVNPHERTMKQLVIATIVIDKTNLDICDRFQNVEQIVVKTIEESSFETLEALAEQIASRVIKYTIWAPRIDIVEAAGVRVQLEKPSAVPLAETPIINIYRSAQAGDPFAQRLSSEVGIKRIEIPFPLEGRLDEFLQSSKQD